MPNGNLWFYSTVIYHKENKLKKILIISLILLVSLHADLFEDGLDASLSGKKYKAMDIWTKSCSYGDLRSCSTLASSYYTIGIKQKDQEQINKALYIWKNSCKKGLGTDCSSVGALYYYGHGISINKKEAKKFYSLACEYNNLEGCQHYKKLTEEGF